MKQKALSIVILSLQYGLMANPSNPTVINGDVSFDSSQAGVLNIQAGDRAIINWQDFSIGVDEMTQFVQPDAGSAVLNRVTGGNASSIMGSLQANGVVYLINPSGVIFGQNSVVDTAAIIASTLDLPDQLFLQAGDLLFSGDSEGIIANFGTIQASNGDAILIGYQVENNGVLSAPNGVAGMAAGTDVLIRPLAQERIYIRVSPDPVSQTEIGLNNTGTMMALQAELKADGNPFSMAINHSGSITATGMQEAGGSVYLVSENGNIDFSGTVMAQDGQSNGGEVYVYGQNIVMEPDAEITVDGSVMGNGGTVELIADNTLLFYGTISARGGDESGDGGFVEVSAPSLDFAGDVSTFAPNGETGTLLIDPNDITISAAPSMPFFPGFPAPALGGTVWNGDFGATPPSTANLQTTQLLNMLAVNNVIIQSAPTVSGGVGDITFEQDFAVAVPGFSSPFSLYVQAANNINVMANVINQGTGNFFFTAVGDINIGDGTQTVPVSLGSFGTNTTTAKAVLTAGGALNVKAGTTAGSNAQLGVNKVVNGVTGVYPSFVYCDIEINTGGDVDVKASDNNGYAAIGHGGPGGSGTRTYVGNITCPIIEGDVTATAANSGTNVFAIIGHNADNNSIVKITGNVSMPAIVGDVELNGGVEFALIGHGSENVKSTSSMTGDIEITANNVTLNAGSDDTDAFVAIGMTDGAIGSDGTTLTITSNRIQVVAAGDITLNPGDEQFCHASIGALFDGTPNTVTVGVVSVNAQGDVVLTGTTETTAALAFIGVTANGGDLGGTQTASGDVVVTAMGNVNLTANAGSAVIMNGDAVNPTFSTAVTALQSVNFNINGNVNGKGFATVASIGPLAITAISNDISLGGSNFSMGPSFTGTSLVSANGPLYLLAGNNVGINPLGEGTSGNNATVTTANGDLTVTAGNNLQIGAYSSVTVSGTASNLVFTTINEDLSVTGNQVSSGNVFIANNTVGDLTFTAGNDLSFNQCTIDNPGAGLGSFGTFSMIANNDLNIGSPANQNTSVATQVTQDGGEIMLASGNDMNIIAGKTNSASIVGPLSLLAVGTSLDITIAEVLGTLTLDATSNGGFAKIGANTPNGFPTGDIRALHVANGVVFKPGTGPNAFTMIGQQGNTVGNILGATSTVDIRGNVTFLASMTAAWAQVGSRYTIAIFEDYPPFVSGTVTGATLPPVMCASPYAVVADVQCSNP